MPLIKGSKKVQYERIYGKYVNSQRMIAKGDWKMISYPKAQVLRLFNTAKDPDAMHDLAGKPDYAAKLKELKVSPDVILMDIVPTLKVKYMSFSTPEFLDYLESIPVKPKDDEKST